MIRLTDVENRNKVYVCNKEMTGAACVEQRKSKTGIFLFV